MKTSIQKLCLVFFLYMRSLGLAVDMKTVTPSELHQELAHQGGKPNGGAIRSQLRQEVVRSERLDLVAACFADSDAKIVLADEFKRLPASDFKTKVVIAMIRAPSDYWPPDHEEGSVFGVSFMKPIMHIQREPFASTIKDLLPGKTLTTDIVRYQGRRNKLANELLAAFQKRGGQITDEEVKAIQSIPLALNTAAEGGTEDPAYTRIPPTEKERYMKEAFEAPKWVPPTITTSPPPNRADSESNRVKRPAADAGRAGVEELGGRGIIWFTVGSAVAVLLACAYKLRRS